MTGPTKIDQKIVSVTIAKPEDPPKHVIKTRPRVTRGSTYKIKPPIGSNAALYITINDIILENGSLHPIEIFINTKDASHQQWITGLTRMISAIFRSSPTIDFVTDELQQVFDPLGGYFDGPKRVNSVVAHIGAVIKEHIDGYTKATTVAEEQREVVNQVPAALLCPNCQQYAAVMKDGCLTCNDCGHSKCG